MKRLLFFIAVILCFPLSSYSQDQTKPKEDHRAFVRPWLTAGLKGSDISNEPSLEEYFRGGIFFLRQDQKYGVDLGAAWMPSSSKFNFRTLVRLKKGLFSDFDADFVHRRNGILPTDASYIKAGAAYLEENKTSRVEVAGGLGVEFLSYNQVGQSIDISDKHSLMIYSLFRFDHSLVDSQKWMLRLESESNLIRDAYNPRGRRLGFNSGLTFGFVYKGYYKGDS